LEETALTEVAGRVTLAATDVGDAGDGRDVRGGTAGGRGSDAVTDARNVVVGVVVGVEGLRVGTLGRLTRLDGTATTPPPPDGLIPRVGTVPVVRLLATASAPGRHRSRVRPTLGASARPPSPRGRRPPTPHSAAPVQRSRSGGRRRTRRRFVTRPDLRCRR